ncbi:multidrug transporter AcrB [Mesobacillus campisalis]|uniref:Multidrug transporter AcrB n=1 Tax=Mesobacillus campisalis TaxID=1408103 RepID=A0A0M2SWA2_9BACI|nr:efflux RND transporter permease subunit [Mesobacillus campisalis]KKK38834.1 multidrug transporter AcrB [Mesobacillus campisalis]
MSWFTKWSFKNKAAVAILSILIMGLGLISYTTMPMEFLPAADQPQVTVVVMGDGSDAETMRESVTEPIESALSGIAGKKNVFSTTGDGYSKTDIFFESKTPMKEAKTDVQEAISSLTLPTNVSKPHIVQLNTSMIPISQITVTFGGGVTPENIEFAEKEILPSFKSIKGVGSVQVMGTSSSSVSLELKEKEMAENGVTLQQFLGVLQGHDTSAAVGGKTLNGEAANIKVIGNIGSLEELGKLPVTPGVLLKDIATVKESSSSNALNHINGEEGLFIVVTKDTSSNAVSVTKEVAAAAEKLNKKFKQQETTVVLDTGEMIQNSVHTMMKEVLLGALFATIVIMVFLRNVRSTVITIVSIPLSLCFTLFLLSRSGITLNILTLGGVAVAVGRLVDDSIVVIENIFRKRQSEPFSVSMIMVATKEVGSAITSSTLTTVAVFLPIGLVSGSLQEFVLPFALTVTYSLLASLVVALTVVPVMSAGLLKNAKLPEHKPPAAFTNFVSWSLDHKKTILLVSGFLFAGSIGTYFAMPKGAVDSSGADFVVATLAYPNTTPVEEVRENSLELEKFILGREEVLYNITQMGNSAEAAQFGQVGSPTQTSFSIILKEKDKTHALLSAIEEQKDNYPGAELTVAAASMMGASSSEITVDVLGDSIEEIELAANEIKKALSGIEGVESVSTNLEEKKMVYSFEVRPEEANAQQVAQQLSLMLNRVPIGAVELQGQKTPVFVEPLLDPKQPDDLNDITVLAHQGPKPISEVAKLQGKEEPTSLYHKDGVLYARVSGVVDSGKISDIAAEMNTLLFAGKDKGGLDLPKEVEVAVGGASVQQSDDFTDLFITMAASVGIVFLIMVITFKTIRAPIAILFSLPLAAIGAILGLLVSRIAVDITALLGALMLIGIVVTNAIVLLDRVKQNEKKMSIRESIVEAAAVRMRPILMTAVATICAMLPLLFKKAESGVLVSQSLAVVVIGGLAVATLLTLVVIPVVYELLHYRKSRKERQLKAEAAEQEQ